MASSAHEPPSVDLQQAIPAAPIVRHARREGAASLSIYWADIAIQLRGFFSPCLDLFMNILLRHASTVPF